LCCAVVQFTSDLTKKRESGGKCGMHAERPEGRKEETNEDERVILKLIFKK
jgi:hypothetical protein